MSAGRVYHGTNRCAGATLVLNPSGVTLKGAQVTLDGGMNKIAAGPGSSPDSTKIPNLNVSPVIQIGP